MVTAVTLAELSVGPLVATGEAERAARQALLQQAETDFYPLRRSGRKVNARSYDAMIAATAIANDLSLYASNPADFVGIDGLTVVGLPSPDRGQRG